MDKENCKILLNKMRHYQIERYAAIITGIYNTIKKFSQMWYNINLNLESLWKLLILVK